MACCVLSPALQRCSPAHPLLSQLCMSSPSGPRRPGLHGLGSCKVVPIRRPASTPPCFQPPSPPLRSYFEWSINAAKLDALEGVDQAQRWSRETRLYDRNLLRWVAPLPPWRAPRCQHCQCAAPARPCRKCGAGYLQLSWGPRPPYPEGQDCTRRSLWLSLLITEPSCRNCNLCYTRSK